MAKQENIRQYMKIMAMAITASRYTTVKLYDLWLKWEENALNMWDEDEEEEYESEIL